jgi:endonuclease-3
MKESKEEKIKRADKVFKILDKHYGEFECPLDYKNPFQLLISTILAAQSTDKQVNKVMGDLYKTKYKSPEDLANADMDTLRKEIHTLGFFNAKAKSITNCSKELVEKYNSKVPETIEELVKLPGVGRKTANVVAGYCFNVPAIMTDTHFMRVSQRLGFTNSDKPDVIEMDLRKVVPEKNQTRFSRVINRHGRMICQARMPVCEECIISKYCPSFEKFMKIKVEKLNAKKNLKKKK